MIRSHLLSVETLLIGNTLQNANLTCRTDYTFSKTKRLLGMLSGGCNKVSLTVICVLALCMVANGQTLSGIVLDASDDLPLTGCIVTALQESGQRASYSITDRNGKFSIALDESVTGIRVTMMGYNPVTLTRPFDIELVVRLSVSGEQIKEARVTASKVSEVGDTVIFNAKALATRSDRALGDLLKRLPGIEVNESGYVNYNGKPINRMYVNGKDLLERNYNLLTENLDIDAVSSVELYRDHQPKAVLRGVRDSDAAGLNIVLQDSSSDVKGLTANDAIGWIDEDDSILYDVGLFAYKVNGSHSSFNTISANDTGEAISEKLNEGRDAALPEDFNINPYKLRQYAQKGAQLSPFGEERSLFNDSGGLKRSDRWVLDNGDALGLSVKATGDQRNFYQIGRTTYSLPDRDISLDEVSHSSNRIRTYGLSSYYEANKPRHYIKESISLDYGADAGTLNYSGSGKPESVVTRNLLNINNTISAIWANNHIRGISLTTQYSVDNQEITLYEDLTSQRVRKRVLFNKIDFMSFERRVGKVLLFVMPSVESVLSSVEALSSGLPYLEEGLKSYELFKLQPELSGKMSYKSSRWVLDLTAGLMYDLVTSSTIGIDTARRLYPEIGLNIKYTLPHIEAKTNISYHYRITDCEELGNIPMMTGLNSAWIGRTSSISSPEFNAGIEFLYREPVSGWNVLLSASHLMGRIYSDVRTVYDNFVILSQSELMVPLKKSGLTLTCSKGFFGINSLVKGTVEYNSSSSTINQNGLGIPFTDRGITVSLKAEMNICKWLGATYNGIFNCTGIEAGGSEKTSFSQLQQAASIDVFLTDNISIRAFVRTVQFNAGRTAVLVDAASEWKISPKFSIELKCLNLGDTRNLSLVSLSPLSESSYVYNLRPLSITLGVRCSL